MLIRGYIYFLFPPLLQVKAEASWDSTVHDCIQLSKGTAAEERVYLIVRATVQLSHPAEMQLVLRKRICVNVYGRQVQLLQPFPPPRTHIPSSLPPSQPGWKRWISGVQRGFELLSCFPGIPCVVDDDTACFFKASKYEKLIFLLTTKGFLTGKRRRVNFSWAWSLYFVRNLCVSLALTIYIYTSMYLEIS